MRWTHTRLREVLDIGSSGIDTSRALTQPTLQLWSRAVFWHSNAIISDDMSQGKVLSEHIRL